ncbi:MAG TPA: type III-B CRISPR-associated protein Cas10/Cmr2 [Cyanobacteria bacterium UBA8803]|nr:type III-B CRISPR-associated protein Cas10/Cmr2 [Cyanobacteria bacterium UBA9273]HBL57936.1 type III-B CRISPR-associated protein Cas10/Cmr2 [Cyanobacteria bacterium UBA8803]
MTDSVHPITTGIAWCLAWGEGRDPQFHLSVLQQLRQALNEGGEVPEEVREIVEQVKQLQNIDENDFPDTLEQLKNDYRDLWGQNTRIGLVYGGATKIKQYVFESAKLPDIRGASALLDRINLVDIPAFFGEGKKLVSIDQWLTEHFPGLKSALIKELLIYYKGANILAFCPVAFIDDLANAIEKRYTEETLTANSAAVGDKFKLLEIGFGLLNESIEQTNWLDWYLKNQENPLVKAYYEQPEVKNPREAFRNRKNFNELVGKLASRFNKRRNGNDETESNRPTRCYPPMLETHPYLLRDDNTRALAAVQAKTIPNNPWLSEPLARKRAVGLLAKRATSIEKLRRNWYQFEWEPEFIADWVTRFNEEFLEHNPDYRQNYYRRYQPAKIEAAQSLTEIGDASKGFVAYIYADGNNMGGYIQKYITTPKRYQKFSEDIFEATKNSVYMALAKHLEPHQLQNLDPDDESTHKNGDWIHPFEILLLGGDDVLIVVPANKALEIAKTIGDKFEEILLKTGRYKPVNSTKEAHRYKGERFPISHCELSTSIGVLITAYNTPIYYAKNLYEQLLKSAKKKAKQLKKNHHYYGGTVDFLTMKSVTMISSNIETFRKEGLTKQPPRQPILKFYGAPYTLHELGGLLKTAEALKKSEFPRSQLYQIRSLLEQGKHTAILNYRYFRTRLKPKNQKLLKEKFEQAWCEAKTNDGNLAPWMSLLEEDCTTTYETIWRELVDLYPFIQESEQKENKQLSNAEIQA